MNFLNIYIAWVLSGDLPSHTEQCENKISGERGICTSLWFCAEVAKGITIGTCKKDQSEDICCRIKRFDGTHESITTSDILNQETDAGLLNSVQTDLPSEKNSLRVSPQTSDGKPNSTSSNASGLPKVYWSPIMVEETNNMKKQVQFSEDFDSRRPVKVHESDDLRSSVMVEEAHNMRKTVQLAEDFDSRRPVRIHESDGLRSSVMVEETHNMRKPVQLAEDFDSQRPVRIHESHDLRWPVVEEDTHDLRNTIIDEYEFPTESTAVEKQSKKKTSDTLEIRHFSNFYEYLENQGYFKESVEKDEVNKECLDVFHKLNKNKTLEKKEQEEKLPYIELLSSASEVCGISYRKTTPRLVGGKESNYLQWPWMVSLRLRRNDKFWHKCGAALLNRLWVITVAHCVEFLPPWDVSLRLGSYNLKREDEAYPYIIRTVEKIIIHPQFSTHTFVNDVALLLMSSPVEFLPNISPICLPKKVDEIDGKIGIVLGWGRKPETRPLSAALHELLLPIISNKECEQMYSTAGVKEKIQDDFFCAGTGEGGSDTCNGDSGGPMSLLDSEGRWSVIGLVSWGGICGAPHQPGVYTRIKNYVEWIEGIIACYQY